MLIIAGCLPGVSEIIQGIKIFLALTYTSILLWSALLLRCSMCLHCDWTHICFGFQDFSGRHQERCIQLLYLNVYWTKQMSSYPPRQEPHQNKHVKYHCTWNRTIFMLSTMQNISSENKTRHKVRTFKIDCIFEMLGRIIIYDSMWDEHKVLLRFCVQSNP